MSGLFLNFYQVEIPLKTIEVHALKYEAFQTKEDYKRLRDNFPECKFYRYNEHILFWGCNEESKQPPNSYSIKIDLFQELKVLSKIFELSTIALFKEKLKDYKVYKNKYSNTWEIISPKDVLEASIDGLVVNHVVNFSPCFFIKDDKVLFGFSLSDSLKNTFTWDKTQFAKHGVDITGLRGDETKIFANKQSIKRFLESKGVVAKYDKIIGQESNNIKAFVTIDNLYAWLERHKAELVLPFELTVKAISKKYLPLENELVKSEIIQKPERYFYSNRKNIQNLQYYNEMVKAYQPYTLELYQNKQISIGIICPLEFQGETENFIKKIETNLNEVFHFKNLSFVLKTIPNKDLESYTSVLYKQEILECNLVFVIVTEAQEKLPPASSPYYVCKAKLIGNGIPTQDIQIETIRANLNAFTMTNIALNTYAKLGGTAWTIEKEDKLRDELIIGIGSSVSDDGRQVLGIAQIFHNDGRYLAGDCSPLSTFENYAENLEKHLLDVLNPLVQEMSKSGTFRLIFHLYKSASEEYEIAAIDKVKQKLSDYQFEFALVHLGYGHNFRFYYNDGKYQIQQGTYVQLSKHTALLHFVKNSDLPLKIDLDKRSNFTSLFYLAKQVYWFSHLSHRSYMPSKRTVTIMYPSLMSKMTEELKKVNNWDYDRLKAVSDKLWFI